MFYTKPEAVTESNNPASVTVKKSTTYCKVSLEGFRSSVGVVSTDLTVVVDVQSVEFIEPVGNWLQGVKHQSEKHTNQLMLNVVQIKW